MENLGAIARGSGGGTSIRRRRNRRRPLDGRLFASRCGRGCSRSAYLLVTNARGTNGFGNHKHNDLLSFEFHSDGTPLIVDPELFPRPMRRTTCFAHGVSQHAHAKTSNRTTSA